MLVVRIYGWDAWLCHCTHNCRDVEMRRRIYVPIWIELIVLLRQGKSAIKSSNILWSTYSHIHNLTKEFEENNWVTKEKKGRVNKFTFTPEGNKVADACEQLLNVSYEFVKKRKKR